MKKLYFFIISMYVLSSHAEVEFTHRWNAWATHQPVLYTIAVNTTGPIIEFGCGDNSTDLLHEICKKEKRLLISLDDNQEWLNKFAAKYSDDAEWHQFFLVPGKSKDGSHWIRFLDNFDLIKQIHFSLCFVDQAPQVVRTHTVRRFKNKADFVILHDCDDFSSGILGNTITPINSKRFIPGVYDFSKTFKYFKVYFPLAPWPRPKGPATLLGSNVEADLPDIDFNNF